MVLNFETSPCQIFIARNPVFSQALLQSRITLTQQLLKLRHQTPCSATVTIQLASSKMMRQIKMRKAKVLKLEQLLVFLHQLTVTRLLWSLKMQLMSRQRYLMRMMRGQHMALLL